jgi:N-acetyl-gamma-glutamyl-phosphate reductase
MKGKINVAIVGVSGFTGLEIVKILVTHPIFNISYVANSEGKTKLTELHPSLQSVIEADVQKANAKDIQEVADVAFLALPHKASMGFAKELMSLGVKVVDLSADYRLEIDTYEKHYCSHIDKENHPNAVYGMPEFYKKDIKTANLIANPGCYPTSALLALIPFVPFIKEGQSVFIDSKSGISGAGKKLSDTTHFVTVNDNMFAYNPLKHRHMPEIEEKIRHIGNKKLKINFVPHLVPITRGMLTSVYVTLDCDIDAKKVLQEYYKDEIFVRVIETPANMKNTAGTNFCDIFVEQNGKDLFINSSIDNLLKGASSAAVVNANLMCGLDEDLGIPKIAYVP